MAERTGSAAAGTRPDIETGREDAAARPRRCGTPSSRIVRADACPTPGRSNRPRASLPVTPNSIRPRVRGVRAMMQPLLVRVASAYPDRRSRERRHVDGSAACFHTIRPGCPYPWISRKGDQWHRRRRSRRDIVGVPADPPDRPCRIITGGAACVQPGEIRTSAVSADRRLHVRSAPPARGDRVAARNRCGRPGRCRPRGTSEGSPPTDRGFASPLPDGRRSATSQPARRLPKRCSWRCRSRVTSRRGRTSPRGSTGTSARACCATGGRRGRRAGRRRRPRHRGRSGPGT